MSELPADVREKTDILDAVGNTTAASGKGFAIASAALTALALFAAFVGIAKIDGIDIYNADVVAGLFVGGMIPFHIFFTCNPCCRPGCNGDGRRVAASSVPFLVLWKVQENRSMINVLLSLQKHP
jgi:hypothetical protein